VKENNGRTLLTNRYVKRAILRCICPPKACISQIGSSLSNKAPDSFANQWHFDKSVVQICNFVNNSKREYLSM